MSKQKKTSAQKVTPTKKRKNGRAKGQGFERVTAKLLTDWWGEEFHRTPASGGLHWKKDNRVSGDIVPPENSNFPFSVECKKVEGWNFEQVIKGTGEVFNWWKQCYTDSLEVEKIPLLIFSKNRSPVYFMIPYEDYVKIDLPQKNYFITTFEIEKTQHTVAMGFYDDLAKVPKREILNKLG